MKLDTLFTSILVACAVITSVVVVKREFFPSVPAGEVAVERKPTFIPHWQDDTGQGVRMGPQQGMVHLVEFADFECPFCGSFHKTLKALRERYPGQVSVEFVHFPLPAHRFALPAARVAECADQQGRFEAMYDQLFDGQESFGLKPWSEYAASAGVPDLVAFDTCIRATEPVPRIEAGKMLGDKLNVNATPTVIVNGWKLGRPPSADELDSMVRNILAGRSPVASKMP